MEEYVYLIFDGSSCDGRGAGTYVKWTLNEEEAIEYYQTKINNNPYSCGCIRRLDKNGGQMIFWGSWC